MTQQDDATMADGIDPVIETLQQEVMTLKAELDRYRDIAGRAQADLQNAKARVEREGDDLRRFASEQIVRKLLPTLDNFQRAFQHIPADQQNHEWDKGIAAIEADPMVKVTDV